MELYSTNNRSLRVDFKEAVFNSLPADKGLYMPLHIPKLDEDFIANIQKYSLQEISFKVATTLLQGAIPEEDLKHIITEAVNFPAPTVRLEDETYVLELFHGPSSAFKDFGARFMSRVMSYFMNDGEKMLDILVATSGDTGGAVALGFLNVPNTRVTILYPKGGVSAVQELQLVTNGNNIRAIEVDGTFDDCQALVKQAFADQELNTKLRLTSANSINIARLIPQTFYYFNAYAQLKKQGKKDVVFSVPSGNFGNLAAGIIAWKMGLPVKQFLAATNLNDTVPKFLKTGAYHPKPSIATLSNAMDVGNPSNWVRIIDLFNDDEALRNLLVGFSFTDEQTIHAIEEIYSRYNYIACPHTAVAWLAIVEWRKNQAKATAIFAATAHPFKFPDVFPKVIADKIHVPLQVEEMKSKPKYAEHFGNDYNEFKAYLLAEL
ncbi:MAG TPA: threonine synthase [Sphingobacteriaceae bacterium]|nr:threonine synthase [Sphingobacteriaceae bacterium]